MRALAAILLLMLLMGRPATADGGTVIIDGLVQHPLTLSAADLAASPATELDNSFLTGHGSEAAHYRGVSLWSLIERAGLVAAPGDKRANLRHYLLITGADGYAVIVAMGEIDPDFEGKAVILAHARDGLPLGSARLIVPGDQHGGRAIKDVRHIEVR
jgi:DMSO/TMAO reductase YedYZ molybdopterin-dependent catalytic subunit